jgi:predicted PurR-regulated permease PerM
VFSAAWQRAWILHATQVVGAQRSGNGRQGPRAGAMTIMGEALSAPEEDTPPGVLVLPPSVENERTQNHETLGVLGRPFDHRTPFFMGLTGALGVALAYVVFRGVADVSSVLIIIGVALFIAIGLNPIIALLVRVGLSRIAAASVVTLGFLLVIGAFVLIAVPPISHEVQSLVNNYPRYKRELIAGQGWAGHVAVKLHLTNYLKGKSKLKLPLAGGALGAGKVLLGIGVGTVSMLVLTIYFMIALPGVTKLWLSLIPNSRRERVRLLTDEVFDRVGGFMLGNLLTSVVAGVGTWVWLTIFGVPYSLLLALFVALFDLIPMVGSTIAGVAVSAVALTKGLPIAVATAAFYIVYRFLEDYLLNPRVMKHTVRISPGLTIVATLIGGALLGLIGALIAIPVAATIHLLLEEVVFPRQNKR